MIGFRPPRVFGPCMFSVSVEAFDRSLSTENLEISRTFAVTADFYQSEHRLPFNFPFNSVGNSLVLN